MREIKLSNSISIENEQFSRDWKTGKHILVSGCGNFNTLNELLLSDTPTLLDGTSTVDKDTLMYIDRVLISGQKVIRSNYININVDSIYPQNADDSELTVHLSQQTNTTFDNDKAFGISKNKESLQDIQLDQSATSICNKYYKYQTALGMIQECLKI